MVVLVTGCAGFIGFYTARRLLDQGFKVVGVDNLNDYYSVSLKNARLDILSPYDNFTFYQFDICNHADILSLLDHYQFDYVIHLAAQAGVRYSLENPFAYTKSNIEGHLSILELCLKIKSLKKLVYASSSSVYGRNSKLPFSVNDPIANPMSLYAASKASAELISQAYFNLYGLPQVGLRFFTVYGPYGRPDMAPYKFTKLISEGKPIEVYNNGEMMRDFTYIDDIIDGIIGAINLETTEHKVYNLGNHKPINLMEFISMLEGLIGKKAVINFKPLQKGDMLETFADITESTKDLGFEPKTDIGAGLKELVSWYNIYKTTIEKL